MPKGKYKRKPHSQEYKDKMRSVMKGRKILWKEKISEALKGKPGTNLGRKFTEEHKRKISESQKGAKSKLFGKKLNPDHVKKIADAQRGDKSHFWKGGISYEPYSIDWTNTLKKAIRERDHYICGVCKKDGYLVHHIDYNKKNCSITNLITLCASCHSKTNHHREQWIKFFK